jgi:hypothetical protein
MTAGWRAAAALLLLLGGVSPVLAQERAVLTDPHDKNAVRPGPGIELGFYDPATGRFTRGAPSASASNALQPVSGTFNVLPDFRFDKAFKSYNTIFCEVTLQFGNVTKGGYFTNHFARGDVNFAAGDPDKVIQIPYAYTPNSDNARARLEISCRGYDNNGVEHSETITYPVENLPDGDVTRQLTDEF